ncbi:MAG TPA: sensor histidine kinase [Actinoplanes sp.]|nr:sensor histidine kinase [Actinoplanes sp.]
MTGSTARAWLLDVTLAAIGAAAAVVLTTELTTGLPASARMILLALAVVHGGALVLRRVTPPGVLAVQSLTAIAYVMLGLPVFMLGPAILVTLYTAAVRLTRRAALVSLGLAEVLIAVLLWAGPAFPGVPSWLQFSALLAAAWFLGDIVRRWQRAAAEHAQRAVELEQAREDLARMSVNAERVRIARELHDVVAHSMSVIAMHAGSGRLAAGRDPEAARRALEVVEESSRTALAEMRRLVTVLREVDQDHPELAPAPGLADLPCLVAQVVTAGVQVDVRTEGDFAAVPEGVSLAAYRIVQEALTNVVRHAGPTRVRLRVGVGEDRVRLEVSDEGGRQVSTAAVPAGAGHGTVGMRERASLYGGELSIGPGPDGGWRVAGWLPCAAVPR